MDFNTHYAILYSRLDNILSDLYVSEVTHFISYYKYYHHLNNYLYIIMYKAIYKYLLMLKYAPGEDICYCNEAYYLLEIIGTPFNFTNEDIQTLILSCLKIAKINCSAFKCKKGIGLYNIPIFRLEGFNY